MTTTQQKTKKMLIPEKAKELFDKMPKHLQEQVLKIDKAMKKIEANDKFKFSQSKKEEKK